MEWSSIVQLMQAGDSVSTKFYKSITGPDELSIAISAFANTIGGMVIVGLDRINLHFVGSNLTDALVNRAVDMVTPRVRTEVSVIEKSGRLIHVIRVEMGLNRPYVFGGKIYSLDESRAWSFKLIEDDAPTVVAVESIARQNMIPNEPLDRSSVDSDLLEPAQPILGLQIDPEISIKMNQRQLKTIDYLRRHSTIQNKIYRQLFGVSHKTAHIELTDLVSRGEILTRGMGRSTHYVIAPK